uniref:Uncharacterized protein n=1 Tax=viral metagenome TaxID=1070528 RepID=A0A6M3IHA8_9ZZZZ
MNEVERIERLEKLYEKMYHQNEKLSVYLPQLLDTLIKHWSKGYEYRESIKSDLVRLRDFSLGTADDLSGLKKGYHTHAGKKRVSKYD